MVKHKVLLDKWHSRSLTLLLVMGSWLRVVNKHYSQVILSELASEDIWGGDHPTVLESPITNGARHFHNTHHPTLTAGERMEKNMLTFIIMGIYVPRNLGICAISRLRCAFSESGNCVPISRLRSQSWDYARRLRNLKIAICERNGLMGWERLSWLMENSWELSEMMMPWMGELHRSGNSLHLYPDRGEESFPKLANFSEVPCVGAWVYMPDIDGDNGAARAHYIRSLPLYTMETRRVRLCMQQKLRDLDYAPVPRDLKIA